MSFPWLKFQFQLVVILWKAPLLCIMPSCYHAWWYPWSLLNPSLKKGQQVTVDPMKVRRVNMPDLGEAKSSKPLTREEWKFIKSLTSATTGNSCSSLGLVRKNQWKTEQSRQATTTSNWQIFQKKKLKRFVEAVALLIYHRHFLEEGKFVWDMKQKLLNMLEQLEIYLAGSTSTGIQILSTDNEESTSTFQTSPLRLVVICMNPKLHIKKQAFPLQHLGKNEFNSLYKRDVLHVIFHLEGYSQEILVLLLANHQSSPRLVQDEAQNQRPPNSSKHWPWQWMKQSWLNDWRLTYLCNKKYTICSTRERERERLEYNHGTTCFWGKKGSLLL